MVPPRVQQLEIYSLLMETPRGEVTLSRQESGMGPLGAGEVRGGCQPQGQPLVQP